MKSCLVWGAVGFFAIVVLAWMTGYIDLLFKVSMWIVSIFLFIGIAANTKNGDGPPGGRPGDQY